MVNSGEVDGEPLNASHHWLTDVLRGELGFQKSSSPIGKMSRSSTLAIALRRR
jgi:hypothetical protein